MGTFARIARADARGRRTAVPLDHGHSLVVLGGLPPTALGAPPMVVLRGRAARRLGVSATPR